MGDPADLNDDFRDMLACLAAARVEFVIVGAHALAAHGLPRATGDIDVFIRPNAENAARVMESLAAFGAPTEAHGIRAADFEIPGQVYQLGVPPRRIDLLTAIDGVTFEDAFASRLEAPVGGMVLPFLGRSALIANKRAAGRPKDLVDVEALLAQRRR